MPITPEDESLVAVDSLGNQKPIVGSLEGEIYVGDRVTRDLLRRVLVQNLRLCAMIEEVFGVQVSEEDVSQDAD